MNEEEETDTMLVRFLEAADWRKHYSLLSPSLLSGEKC